MLWLWCRPAAVAPIQFLAWELPYVTGVALKKAKTNKQTKTNLTSKATREGRTNKTQRRKEIIKEVPLWHSRLRIDNVSEVVWLNSWPDAVGLGPSVATNVA